MAYVSRAAYGPTSAGQLDRCDLISGQRRVIEILIALLEIKTKASGTHTDGTPRSSGGVEKKELLILRKLIEAEISTFRSMLPCSVVDCGTHCAPPASLEKGQKRSRDDAAESITGDDFIPPASKRVAETANAATPSSTSAQYFYSFGSAAAAAAPDEGFVYDDDDDTTRGGDGGCSTRNNTAAVVSVHRNRTVNIVVKDTFQEECFRIRQALGEDQVTCRLSGGRRGGGGGGRRGKEACHIAVSVKTEEKHRELVHYLETNKMEYFVTDSVGEPYFKVVVKGLPPQSKSRAILDVLTRMGYPVLRVTQLRRQSDKLPLPIFQVQVRKGPRSNRIFDVKELMEMTVQVERFFPLQKSDRCYNCQDFGHHSDACRVKPRCVKCAGQHNSVHCSKSSKTPARCANCGKDHPASYRGCDFFPKPEFRKFSSLPGEQQRPPMITTRRGRIIDRRPQQHHHHAYRPNCGRREGLNFVKTMASRRPQTTHNNWFINM